MNKTTLKQSDKTNFTKLFGRIYQEDKTKDSYKLRIYYSNGFRFQYIHIQNLDNKLQLSIKKL